MDKVVVYTNEIGNVCVCTPCGDLTAEEVKIKDCPADSIVIDRSELPQGLIENYFSSAWKLDDNGHIYIDLATAKTFALGIVNQLAVIKAQRRYFNTLAGITNDLTDEAYLSLLSSTRASITTQTDIYALKSLIDAIEAL